MASESGRQDLAVAQIFVKEKLRQEPYRFEFFQAIRLLERLMPERTRVGQFQPPIFEVARFEANNLLAFPASQIQSIQWADGQQPVLSINFMGLTGPMGVLPLVYTEMIRARVRARDHSMRAFFDLFNHRAVSLFYQAWEKYRFTVQYERGGEDRMMQSLMDLIGIGTRGLQRRHRAIRDESLVFYTGILSLQTRSAEGLVCIVEDYFGVPAYVEQFVGVWRRLDRTDQCELGEPVQQSEQLGFGAVVGDEVWDQTSRARLVLGPLTLAQYRSFLPTGSAAEELRELTRFYTRNDVELEVQLVLRADQTPPCELDDEAALVPQLGWTTWAKTKPMTRDPAEAIFSL